LWGEDIYQVLARLLLAIIAIGAGILLRSSCHLEFRSFNRLMARSTRSGLMLQIQTSCSVQYSTRRRTGALQLMQVTG
jgi:TRAP-type C4-dicarboxylate transport system permease small subunit